jgi:transposase
MSRGRPVKEIKLSPEEHGKLSLIAQRPKSQQGMALRARIILGCSQGKSNQAVAKDLKLCVHTVGKWRRRFGAEGLAGLVDAPRSGAPREISDQKVEEVVTKTLETTPPARTHWSSWLMAKEAKISQHSVRRIWQAFGLKPHLVKSFKLSSDPMFVEKVRDIVGLYLNPPEKAIVLCIDEKSQTQALERTQPILPMRPGCPERQSHDYYRHGIVSLFSAYDVATGEVIGKCHSRHREEEFLKFMNLVDAQLSGAVETQIHIVMDNLATHKTPRVRNWFARRPYYVLHFTPTGSSWINQVERWFAKITTQAIRRGSFASVKELIQTIDRYIAQHNHDPKPFRWTASANSIFDKISASLD